MASIKVEKDSPAFVQRSTLLTFKGAISNFLQLTKSCRSPRGKMKILQNSSGGSMTLTSSSKRLLQSLSVRKPIIQLLVSATQGHLSAYSDGGLFLASFAADLVLRSAGSNHNPKILAEVYETFLTICLDYLNSDICTFKHTAMMSSIKFMKSFVISVLGTKPLCQWDESKLVHISNLVLETFLKSLSDDIQSFHASDNVYVMAASGLDILESRNMCGLLLPAPELSKFKVKCLKPNYMVQSKCKTIKVALITVSLSGDLDELSGVNYEVNQDISVDTVVLEGLSDFCESMVQSNVGLVLCQKVIHPKLKLSLRKSGVIVIDRIGLQPVKYIVKLTGCVPIQCLDVSTSENAFGYIDGVQHKIFDKTSYLHLTRADNPVSTLMLYHLHEQPLNELKDVCVTSLDSLQQLLHNPTVLSGGGCWQVGLANYLRIKIEAEKEKLSEDLECPVFTVQQACRLFIQALVTASLEENCSYSISRHSGHLFRKDDVIGSGDDSDDNEYCSCGICKAEKDEELIRLKVEDMCSEIDIGNLRNWPLQEAVERRKSIVIDSFTMCINALQTSVLTACSVLKIGQVVENL